jgi:hypothetical protein
MFIQPKQAYNAVLSIIYSNIMVLVWISKYFAKKKLCFCFVYLFRLPCVIFASYILFLFKYILSLFFVVATLLHSFFSVIGAITVLCTSINTLLCLCVVPFVIVTDFPLVDCTMYALSLYQHYVYKYIQL